MEDITKYIQAYIDIIGRNHSVELHGQDQWVCEAVGEYRRNKPNMTGIDILIYPTSSLESSVPFASNTNSNCIVRYLLNELSSNHFLTEDISLPHDLRKLHSYEIVFPTKVVHETESDVDSDYRLADGGSTPGSGPHPTTSYHGICQLPANHHTMIQDGKPHEASKKQYPHRDIYIHVSRYLF